MWETDPQGDEKQAEYAQQVTSLLLRWKMSIFWCNIPCLISAHLRTSLSLPICLFFPNKADPSMCAQDRWFSHFNVHRNQVKSMFNTQIPWSHWQRCWRSGPENLYFCQAPRWCWYCRQWTILHITLLKSHLPLLPLKSLSILYRIWTPWGQRLYWVHHWILRS